MDSQCLVLLSLHLSFSLQLSMCPRISRVVFSLLLSVSVCFRAQCLSCIRILCVVLLLFLSKRMSLSPYDCVVNSELGPEDAP